MSGRYFLRNKRKMDSPIPAKITKLEPMDPFQELSVDLHDLILKYFCVEELLELSLVSKSFNKTIGRSPYCMNRMKLNLNKGNKYANKGEYVSVVLASSREYRTIENDYITKDEMRAVLEKFSGSIRELWTSNDVKCVELPNLRALFLDFNPLPDGLLVTNMQHIEDLLVFQPTESSAKLLKKTLKSMSGHLRILNVGENVFDERLDFPKLESLTGWSNNFSYAQLISIMTDLPNLRSFEIHYTEIERWPDTRYEDDLPDNYSIKELICYPRFAEKHLKAFKGLECLRIDKIIDGKLLDDIFSLPSLTKVEYGGLSNDLSKSEKLDVLKRIKEQKKIEFVYDYGSLDDLEAKVNSLAR